MAIHDLAFFNKVLHDTRGVEDSTPFFDFIFNYTPELDTTPYERVVEGQWKNKYGDVTAASWSVVFVRKEDCVLVGCMHLFLHCSRNCEIGHKVSRIWVKVWETRTSALYPTETRLAIIYCSAALKGQVRAEMQESLASRYSYVYIIAMQLWWRLACSRKISNIEDLADSLVVLLNHSVELFLLWLENYHPEIKTIDKRHVDRLSMGWEEYARVA